MFYDNEVAALLATVYGHAYAASRGHRGYNEDTARGEADRAVRGFIETMRAIDEERGQRQD